MNDVQKLVAEACDRKFLQFKNALIESEALPVCAIGVCVLDDLSDIDCCLVLNEDSELPAVLNLLEEAARQLRAHIAESN